MNLNLYKSDCQYIGTYNGVLWLVNIQNGCLWLVNTHGDVCEGGAGEAADVGAEAVTHAVEAEAGVEAVGQAQQTLTHTWSGILIGQ